MWVMLTTGALSIVERRDIAKDDPNTLVVRSRRKEWLNAFRTRYCPELTKSAHVEGRDYQWRAYGTAQDIAVGVGRAALDIHYSNFKSATGTAQYGLRNAKLRRGLTDAYHKVWDDILEAGDGTSVYDHAYTGGYTSLYNGIDACKRWGHWWKHGEELCMDCDAPNPNYPDAGPEGVKPTDTEVKAYKARRAKQRQAKPKKKSAKVTSYGLGTGHTYDDPYDRDLDAGVLAGSGCCSGSWSKPDMNTHDGSDGTVECGVCHTRQDLSDSGRIIRVHWKKGSKAA